jgi:ethanolamine utilization protein EutP
MCKKKKRLILIGRSRAGKSTLIQYLYNKELKYSKTQMIEVINDVIIDTPGEFLEQYRMRGAINLTACDCDYIFFVQQANDEDTMFPPGYSASFGKPCIGVITKSDLGSEEEIDHGKMILKDAGVERVFVTSSKEGTGFEELLEYISNEGIIL